MHRPRTRHDLGSSSCVFLLTVLHEKLGAAILRPARFAVLETDRPLLAVAEDRDPSLGDALGHEIIHRRLCTSITERKVVLCRSTLVTGPSGCFRSAIASSSWSLSGPVAGRHTAAEGLHHESLQGRYEPRPLGNQLID